MTTTTKPQPNRSHLLLLPLIAIFATLPLILHGCSCGHDFDFHLLSWMEAAAQLRHGILFPHWAYAPAWNAGEPRFIFYPPLSWMIGELLGLLSGWTTAPIAYTWIALTAAGLALHRLVHPFSTPNAALLAAALYIVNPYMLFTAYERGAYGELLAAAWIPLLLHAALADRPTIPAIALPVALLWISNAPAAVLGCYALATITILRLCKKNHGIALPITAGTLLGLALAAFYIVPATYERRWVQINLALTPNLTPPHNFLFGHTNDPVHDQILHTVSIIAILLIAATIAVFTATCFSRRTRSPQATAALLPLAILAAIIVLLLTKISTPIWRILPELPFLQFPWRWLVLFAVITAFTLGIALSRIQLRPIGTGLLAILLAAILTTASIHTFRQYCDEYDIPTGLSATFQTHAGVDPTDEYTPIGASNERLGHLNQPFWLAQSPAAPSPITEEDTAPSLLHHFTINSPKKQTLILNLRNYPAWRIRINGILTSARAQRSDGLIALPIAAGPSSIDIAYATTPDIDLGRAITVLAFLLLLAEVRLARRADLSSTKRAERP